MEAKEVAQRAGLSHQVVLRYLRLGEGPEVLRAAVRAGMRVTVDGIEKTRRHALEALRIHTAVFEPADRSPHKRRALARLEALIRRALTEGWTRNRWRSHLAALSGERRKGNGLRRSAAPDPDALRPSPAEPESAGEGLPNAGAAPDALEADGSKSALEVDTLTHAQALDLLDRTLADSSREELLAVAERLDAVCARIVRGVEPAALFSRTDDRLVVHLDRLDGRPVDAFQRSALIKQTEAVLSAARRAVAA